ncbi:STAS domain-containing protein [Actinoplanes regularis]|uniref:Anti-sigma factor antagonist n=1 Tax=Actinoplanes regularis TaxID=52697 RepID=A0A239GXM5_9ACTN|nr:STAS domain-containing protein [Actinoplanes regularis]GIE90944.1 hypothetical protein Are01nite_74240 [Actinoplanes regularis]SNS73910.1 anti-anti-sigma factor [Actinoplanes regularis]
MLTSLTPVTPSSQLTINPSCSSAGAVRVAVAGEIDLSTTGMLQARLLTVLYTLHPHRIEVDLANVPFMDCSGLTVLVAVGLAATRTGCQLRITNPQPIVLRVLDLTGLRGSLTAEFDPAPLVATAAEVTVSAGILVAA